MMKYGLLVLVVLVMAAFALTQTKAEGAGCGRAHQGDGRRHEDVYRAAVLGHQGRHWPHG